MSKKDVQTENVKAKESFDKIMESAGAKYGIHYNIGEIQTIKGNMKKGCFQLLGGDDIGVEITCQILKHVTIKNKVLYPSKEPNAVKKAQDWQHIIYIKDGVLCGTLIKSYSLSRWSAYLEDLRKASKEEGSKIGHTSVYTTIVIADSGKKNAFNNEVYEANFYFCKNADGEPCSYWDFKKNAKTKGAVIDFVSDADYDASKEFFQDMSAAIYDRRVLEELATQNYPTFEAIDKPKELKLLFLAYQNGYMTESEAAANAKAFMDSQKMRSDSEILSIE